MANCATFEQAFSASAFTGRDVFAFADDNDNERNPTIKRTEKPWGILSEGAFKKGVCAVAVLTEQSSTLLQHSAMFELVGGFPKETETFAFPERETFSGPREFLARIGNYMRVENPEELARFIARNSDIAELLEQAARHTANHPRFSSGDISVFSEPSDSDYCVYVNADLAVDRYEDAYAIENQVFSEVLEPHFDKLNFRIILSFDTESDD